MSIQMIEKVAKAINKNRGIREYGEWQFYIPHAIASITAMKAPTEAMMAARRTHLVPREVAHAVWEDMIEVALRDE